MSSPLVNNRRLFKRPMKFVLILLVLIVTTGAVFYGQLGAADPDNNEDVFFVVENGSTVGRIALDLEREGLIKNANAFLLYARATGSTGKLKAGQYILKSSWNIPQVMDILVKGRVATVSFTIPEGYHLRQIAEVLVTQGLTSEEQFWQAVKVGEYNYSFMKDLPKTERRLEGFLFPDTYIIPKGMTVENILDVMLKRFDQVYKKLPPNMSGLNMYEVVTLASIVEGESMLDEERPMVASVFLNRLNIGMKLDSDATVQYLFEKRKTRVLYKDLEIDSPYNTYRNKGLPPGPIGSPGEASLRAVHEPAKSKYLYFVARKDNSGEHVFASTLQEHNVNKRKLGY